MKKLEKEGNLDENVIESIMKEEKPNQKARFSIREAFKNQQQQGQKQNSNSSKQQSDGTKQKTITQEQLQSDFNERREFEYNRQEKRERFKARREKIE